MFRFVIQYRVTHQLKLFVQTALDYAEPGQRMIVGAPTSIFLLVSLTWLPSQLVEGIRPILPLIRNTPYGKRIQSKLQRDQLEGSYGGPYGGAYTPHGRPYGQPSMRRASQIDSYVPTSNVYGMPQPASQQMVQPNLIPAQVRHISHQTMDAYTAQQFGHPRSSVSSLVGSQFNGIAPPYSNTLNGNNGYITASMSDPYQRATYPYV